MFQSYALSAAQSVLAYLLSEGLAPSYSFDDDDATVLVNMFMFVYFGFGVAGGWFADHIGGNYPTEIACSVVWALGSIVMCFAVAPGLMSGLDGSDAAAPTLTFLFVGLALVAVGYGVVNPLQVRKRCTICIPECGRVHFRMRSPCSSRTSSARAARRTSCAPSAPTTSGATWGTFLVRRVPLGAPRARVFCSCRSVSVYGASMRWSLCVLWRCV